MVSGPDRSRALMVAGKAGIMAALEDAESLPRGGFCCCRLCHVPVANKPSLEDHLRGKKHQRLEHLRTARHAQEQRSVFGRGFRKGTPASERSDYFQAYGEVVDVVMDKEKTSREQERPGTRRKQSCSTSGGSQKPVRKP
ncbi:speckle targeted PIP5K1A-regulated poly(A) polymerase-like [Hemicordylus capensis]|uniref:speckle targeted PIP5K1A-regulated poly(A) polymerase-like n=1 Tax=Hemicordylus capensis TaxID=884348 RepID=UPI002302AF8F|nr:speckle targeted PIP5K1A-regulated poly(A) polymerase-like [Hemicordylus capensis]